MPHRHVIDHVRRKICLSNHDDAFELAEDAVAKDLGVDRSHVRDAFHALAFGGFVEIVQGGRARTRPLDAENRDTAFEVYREIAGAAANCAYMTPVPDSVRRKLAAAARHMERDTPDETAQLHAMSTVMSALGMLIPDSVMRHALDAAHWRVARWRICDMRADPLREWADAQSKMQTLRDSAEMNEAGYVMRTAAGISGSFMRWAPRRSVG